MELLQFDFAMWSDFVLISGLFDKTDFVETRTTIIILYFTFKRQRPSHIYYLTITQPYLSKGTFDNKLRNFSAYIKLMTLKRFDLTLRIKLINTVLYAQLSTSKYRNSNYGLMLF